MKQKYNREIDIPLYHFGLENPLKEILTSTQSVKVKEKNKMASIRETAQVYEPKTTKNVTELAEISTEEEIVLKKGTDKEGAEFEYNVITRDGQDYRIPFKVIGDIKTILEDKPDTLKFKVKSKGTGFATQYTVIVLE